jgi:hypothetical protein
MENYIKYDDNPFAGKAYRVFQVKKLLFSATKQR